VALALLIALGSWGIISTASMWRDSNSRAKA
jgi:hypothetical protein